MDILRYIHNQTAYENSPLSSTGFLPMVIHKHFEPFIKKLINNNEYILVGSLVLVAVHTATSYFFMIFNY